MVLGSFFIQLFCHHLHLLQRVVLRKRSHPFRLQKYGAFPINLQGSLFAFFIQEGRTVDYRLLFNRLRLATLSLVDYKFSTVSGWLRLQLRLVD